MDNFIQLCARYRRETVVSEDRTYRHDAQQLLDHPGRGRNRLHRHGARRRVSGARAFTSTSGPGISLMNELLGLAYYTEIRP